MQIAIEYDKKLVMQALRYHFISQPEIKVLMILVNIFAIASAVLYFLGKIPPQAFFLGSCLWLTLLVIFWFMLPGMVYKRASSTLQDNFIMTLTGEEARIENQRGEKTWDWNEFSHFIESPHFFHLYFNARSFFLVPKNGCTGSDQIHEVRLLLREKIKKKKK